MIFVMGKKKKKKNNRPAENLNNKAEVQVIEVEAAEETEPEEVEVKAFETSEVETEALETETDKTVEESEPKEEKAEEAKPEAEAKKITEVELIDPEGTADSEDETRGGFKFSLDNLYYLVFPTGIFFMELALHIIGKIPFDTYNLIGVILMSLAFGGLLHLLSGVFVQTKVNKWVGFALFELLTILFVITYFTDNSYKVFMDIPTIFSGAGDVVNGFMDRLTTILTQGILVILSFHIPAAAYLVLTHKKIKYERVGIKRTLIIIAAILVCYGGSYFVNKTAEKFKDKFTSEFEYDTAVRSFGLLAAVDREISLGQFGQEKADVSFESVESFDPPAYEAEPKEEASLVDMTPNSGLGAFDNSGVAEDLGGLGDTNSEAPKATPKVYGDNVMDIDFETLIANESNKDVAKIHEYVSGLKPSKKNDYTGLFKGKNLILITAEAFSKEVIDEERTPTLYRMSHKGIVFNDYYQPAWGGSTSTGEYSNVMGIVPTNGVKSIKDTIGHNLYFTMGNQLQRLGYFSRAYHDGDYTYYSRNETHTNLGYDEFIAFGNGLEEGMKKKWPSSDLDMMKYTMEQYINEQPFSVYYMTVSGHCLYNNKGNAMSSKNREVTENLPNSSTVNAYLACNEELEYALTYMIERLEEAGIADDTVIVLGTDHYPYGLEKSTTWGNDRDYLSELYGGEVKNNMDRDHSALIIWSKCLEDMDPIVIDEPTYSLDIVPTLSNLFGLEYDSRLLVGRDVLSDEEAIVLWGDYDWKTKFGYYDSSKSEFIPNEDWIEVDDDYIKRIKSIVRNKISFSKSVNLYDYYGRLFGPDKDPVVPRKHPVATPTPTPEEDASASASASATATATPTAKATASYAASSTPQLAPDAPMIGETPALTEVTSAPADDMGAALVPDAFAPAPDAPVLPENLIPAVP